MLSPHLSRTSVQPSQYFRCAGSLEPEATAETCDSVRSAGLHRLTLLFLPLLRLIEESLSGFLVQVRTMSDIAVF